MTLAVAPGRARIRQLAPRALHVPLCLAAAIVLLPAFRLGSGAATLLTLLIALGAAAPSVALLLLAGLLPIAPAAAAALSSWPSRVAECVPLAVLAGVYLRRILAPSGPHAPAPFNWAALAFASVVVASTAVQVALVRVVLSPEGFSAALHDLIQTYYDGSRTFVSLVTAVRLLTAIGLGTLFAQSAGDTRFAGRLVRMFLVGGAAVGCLNAARMAGAALRSATPLLALADMVRLRISAPYGDPNATGSYFALLLPISVAMTYGARGKARWCYGALAIVHAAALWMSGSRAALIAIAVVGGALLLSGPRRTMAAPRKAALIGAGVAALLLVAVAFPNPLFDRRSTVGAMGIRTEMARVAVRLWRTEPVLGIGPGRFLERSASFILDPYVRALYGRENAHNNFLQILAELGALGAAAFAMVLFAALRRPAPFGLRAGIAAFLITCLAGHPLLIPDVQFAFWMALGLSAGLTADTRPAAVVRGAALMIVAAALVAVPFAYIRQREQLSLDHVGYGLSEWRTYADGTRYRRSEGDATIFVPRNAGRLMIGVRPDPGARLPLRTRIWLNGRLADEFVVAADDWRTYLIAMPSGLRDDYVALRLAATDSAGEPAALLVQKVTTIQ